MDASERTAELISDLSAMLNDVRVLQALAHHEASRGREQLAAQLLALTTRLAELEKAVDTLHDDATAPGVLDVLAGFIGAMVRALIVL